MIDQNIPVIDISRLEQRETRVALDAACREWGFFQLVAHGIAPDVVTDLHEQMRAFFAQPITAKQAIARTADNPWGFYDRELTKNTRDWKQIYDCRCDATGEPSQPWPVDLPAFKSALVAYYRACESLAFRILSAISVNLGAPPEALAKAFRPTHTSFLRLNYYPVCDAPASTNGVGRRSREPFGVNQHTDAGALTILLQDEQAGLEVYRQRRWHLVEPRRDALVVNIGDIVQVWSNDRYRAALHRVRASAAAARFSAPFFFNPAYETDYAPLPTACDARRPAKYRPVNWGEFRALRAAGDYADCGEEIQIDRYQIEDAR